ncbi:DUF6978 family protein [Latilactobacillus sakei]|uniref:DUF6978 family protein n=1 Tax=Latilactobacillus sakei TaxID=1599 RepID=UPI001F4BF5E3|nr:hypothetical protein [Latilactobacillus sakei]UNC22152.1 hypothetical protein FXV74_09405 [Latilactobacillus sakei]UNC23979.1 hypothetical protein FX989_09015 [Latilactobacillus sakei]
MTSLKNPSNRLGVQQIQEALVKSVNLFNEEIYETTVVVGVVDNIEYSLHCYCGDASLPAEFLSYSIHLRFKNSNEHLARLDINGRHKNPGEKVARRYNHLHIYSNRYAKRDRIAIAVDPHEFPNVQSIVNTFNDFLKKVNFRNNVGGDRDEPV